jgi:hypothetical protein
MPSPRQRWSSIKIAVAGKVEKPAWRHAARFVTIGQQAANESPKALASLQLLRWGHDFTRPQYKHDQMVSSIARNRDRDCGWPGLRRGFSARGRNLSGQC